MKKMNKKPILFFTVCVLFFLLSPVFAQDTDEKETVQGVFYKWQDNINNLNLEAAVDLCIDNGFLYEKTPKIIEKLKGMTTTGGWYVITCDIESVTIQDDKALVLCDPLIYIYDNIGNETVSKFSKEFNTPINWSLKKIDGWWLLD